MQVPAKLMGAMNGMWTYAVGGWATVAAGVRRGRAAVLGAAPGAAAAVVGVALGLGRRGEGLGRGRGGVLGDRHRWAGAVLGRMAGRGHAVGARALQAESQLVAPCLYLAIACE